MQQYPVDFQYECRGKTLDWFNMDNSNFSKYEADIQYRFNDNGFRMDIDMDDVRPSQPLYIGDSTTMGFGTNIEDTWSYKHHKKYHPESQYVNLAVSSGSLETTSRLLDYWLPILKPSKVYLLENAGNRQEFFNHDGIATVIGVWRSRAVTEKHNKNTKEDILLAELFDRFVSPKENLLANKQRSLNAIHWVCRNVNFNYFNHFPQTKTYIGGSRDGFHSSPEQHNEILKWVESQSGL